MSAWPVTCSRKMLHRKASPVATSLYTERDMDPLAAETQAPWQEDRFGFR